MESRAWRLAAGTGGALLLLVALVAWRGGALRGDWLLALRVTALLAVGGLLAVVVLAALWALRPLPRREVVVRVPAAGADGAHVVVPSGAVGERGPDPVRRRPPRGAAASGPALRTLVLLAGLSAAPVLVVLVLAAPASDHLDAVGGGLAGAAATSSGGAATTGGATPPSSPATANPGAPGAAPSAPVPAAPSDPPSDPATATPPPAPPPATPPAAASVAPAPGGQSVAQGPGSAPTSGASATACRHEVVTGDSLWRIAAADLGSGATAAQVDARWRAVYAANAGAIGADPDVVHPGLALSTC